MIAEQYKQQLDLLLNVLPEVAKEKAFALHGGTAINLFVRDMPRLSVDIDLTYRLIEDRVTSHQHINQALQEIEQNLLKVNPSFKIEHKPSLLKLIIESKNAQIKLEVNQINRGLLGEPVERILCNKAQEQFDTFVAIDVVSLGQLYGGKICAALDRQHPRDLFDVKYLLKDIGINDEIKSGLMLALVSSNQALENLLHPNLLDQKAAMQNQFSGMTEIEFNYDHYETTRFELIHSVQSCLNKKDKQFLLSIKNAEPDWSIYNYEQYPSVQWKLINIQKHKQQNSQEHKEQLAKLQKRLASF